MHVKDDNMVRRGRKHQEASKCFLIVETKNIITDEMMYA